MLSARALDAVSKVRLFFFRSEHCLIFFRRSSREGIPVTKERLRGSWNCVSDDHRILSLILSQNEHHFFFRRRAIRRAVSVAKERLRLMLSRGRCYGHRTLRLAEPIAYTRYNGH